MRETVLRCDCCGKVMDSSRLRIVMFPYNELEEFCDGCSPMIETKIRDTIREVRNVRVPIDNEQPTSS